MGIITGRWLMSKMKDQPQEKYDKWKKTWFIIALGLIFFAIVLLFVGLGELSDFSFDHYERRYDMLKDKYVIVSIEKFGEDGGITVIGGLLLLYSIGLLIGTVISSSKEEEAAKKYILENYKTTTVSCVSCKKSLFVNIKNVQNDGKMIKCPYCGFHTDVLEEIMERDKLLTDNKHLIEPYMDKE